MNEIRFFLFGTPRIERNGIEVAPKHRKALALLAYLVLERRPHARDALATLLFPDFDSSHALSELRRLLYALNKVLGKAWVEADRQTIALAQNNPIQVDVDAFQLLHSDCLEHGHDARSTCQLCVQPLTKAIEIYTAPFMEGFSLPDTIDFDTWQRTQATTLHLTSEKSLEKLATFYLHQNKLELALQYTRQLLSLNPLHENTYCLLMSLEVQANRRTAALHYYDNLVHVLQQELGIEPSERTKRIAQQLKQGDTIVLTDLPPVIEIDTSNSYGTLPAQTIPFVGRNEELMTLTNYLTQGQQRLITIVGPGGMGKTHLSLIIGEYVQAHYQDGAYFVPLAPLTDSDDIIPAIAEAIDYQFQQDNRDRRTQLFDYLRKKHLLLILDNYEHLITGASLISDMLKAISQLTILVTSRQRLNQSGETIFYLDGLGLPDSDDSISDYDAIRLFLQSAQQVQPDFTLTDDNSMDVVQVCRLVQGMPLGIMLAASWLSMLTVNEIVEEIEQGIDFLASDMVDLPQRQRSIRAVFDHSWNLLTPAEREVFMRLAVFRGGFTREAITAVTGGDLRMLIQLSNKSLIRRDKSNGRYQIHELLRQYAEEQLIASGHQDENDKNHACYYLDYLVNFLSSLKGHGQVHALKLIEADYDNIKVAWQWAVQTVETELIQPAIEPLTLYYQLGSRVQEGQRVFESARQQLYGKDKATTPYAHLSVRFRKPTDFPNIVREHLQIGLVEAENRQDKHEEAYCHIKLGELAHHNDHAPLVAIKHYDAGIAIYRRLDARFYLAEALSKLGEAIRLIGNVEKNVQLVQESYRIQQAIGDEFGASQTMRALGMMTFLAGDYGQSYQYCINAVDIQSKMNYVAGRINNTIYVGILTYFRGEISESRRIVEQSLHMAEDIGLQSAMGWALATISTYDSFAGDYDLAESHLNRSNAIQTNPFQQVGAGDSWLQLTLTWASVVLLLGREQYAEAKALLHPNWQQTYDTRSISYATMFMPIVAILQAQSDNLEYAVELLGLTFAQSELGTDWMHHWVQLSDTRATLQNRLDDETFATAWDRGQQYDLLQTTKTILDTFWTN